MNIIHNYVESMFLNVPSTPEMIQLKEDILGNMEDKYQELLAEGKSENEAVGTVISEFGNIDEILEEFDLKSSQKEDESHGEFTLPVVDWQEAESYMEAKRRAGLFVGLGVVSCMFGVSVVSLSLGRMLDRGFPEIWKTILLFLFIAIGVACFIYAGFQLSPFKFMEKKFVLEKTVREEVERRKQANRSSFVLSMTLGVVLCILALIPSMILGLSSHNWIESVGNSLFLIIVSAGVFLFCYGGNVQSSYTILLEHGMDRQPTEKEMKKNRVLQVFNATYWPLMVAVYLLWSFLTKNWGISWIVFPIGGIIGGAIQSLLEADDK